MLPVEAMQVAECAQCRREIYEDDLVYRIDDGGYVHDECTSRYAKERVYDAFGTININGQIE